MSFGQRLKELREESKLTREELSKIQDLGISYWSLIKYENDQREPDFDTLKRFADYFNVSVDYLLGRTDLRNQTEITAAHRSDNSRSDLPEEAIREIENFEEFIKNKYKDYYKKRGDGDSGNQ